MKLTKYEHACFTVEKDHKLLVVDPGSYSGDFIAPEHVAVIVITHQHQDHFDPDILAAIYNKNPNSLLLADQSIIDLMPDHRGQAVHPGERISVEDFDIEFFGGNHANIHESIPTGVNVGVMINDLLYYPGDSLTIPNKPVDTLAIPAAAPWLKIGEAMDFLLAVKPRLAFPTHDAILSEIGQDLSDALLGRAASSAGIEYRRLTHPIEI
jgi:L-ascorbate metabolism protein UlaG (beta-lactamase superfamily)